MGTIVPPDAAGKVLFFETHVTQWGSVATSIGTTTAIVTALNTKVVAARAALNAQQAAADAAKAATLAAKNAVATMNDAGIDIIKSIKTKAATDPNVYVLAQIPAPATPTPVGPPGTPTDFAITLQQNGALTLTWKCANPPGASGTIYQVYRKIGTAAEFSFVGASGQRKFVDSTLPSIAGRVTYQIMGVRSTSFGDPAQFNVNFGIGGAGEMTASVAQAPKLAA
jgi:hypothetical protein